MCFFTFFVIEVYDMRSIMTFCYCCFLIVLWCTGVVWLLSQWSGMDSHLNVLGGYDGGSSWRWPFLEIELPAVRRVIIQSKYFKIIITLFHIYICSKKCWFNPNKAGLFEGDFFWREWGGGGGDSFLFVEAIAFSGSIYFV